MGLRELLILVLILAIVGVIVRGLYVALRARRGQLRMALEKNVPQYDPDEITLSELPNGGARMVERSFAHVVRQNSEFSSRDKLGSSRDKIAKGDQAIPVLMDSVDDEDEDEVVSPARSSSVATARNAARQKHSTLGSKTVVTPKPTHRPIDVMPARAAPLAASASAPAAAFAADLRKAGEASTRTYDDPLDSHVFKDDELIAYDDREEWPETDAVDDGDYDDDRPDDGQSDDFDDDEDDSYTEGLDDEIRDDEGVDDEVGQEFEDDIEDEIDDDFEDDLEDDQYEDDLDGDNDYDDEVDDEDDDLDADDVETDDLETEEFESVYGQDRDEPTNMRVEDDSYDEYDDEVEDLDDYPEDEEARSGPRRWLQWAGDKISGMTSAAVSRGEREREKDAIDRKHNADRAEPMIGGNSFDDSMMEESVPAPRPAPAPTPRSKPEPLHKSRQSELFDEDRDDGHGNKSGFDNDDFADNSFNANDDYEEEAAPARESRAETATRAKRAEAPANSPAKSPAKVHAKVPAQTATASADYSEVLVLNVVAKPDREFVGVDLLPVLLTTGLRFGDMSIFHRHLDNDSHSPVLFSVANIVNPGTFDLNQINDFATRGLCFFMTLPNVANSMQAFDLMLDVAQKVRIALDGDLKDDNRSVMTAQTIEHYRQRVRDFDLRQMRQQK